MVFLFVCLLIDIVLQMCFIFSYFLVISYYGVSCLVVSFANGHITLITVFCSCPLPQIVHCQMALFRASLM